MKAIIFISRAKQWEDEKENPPPPCFKLFRVSFLLCSVCTRKLSHSPEQTTSLFLSLPSLPTQQTTHAQTHTLCSRFAQTCKDADKCVCLCVFLASCSYCSAAYQSFGRSDDKSRGPAPCFLFTLPYSITTQLTHCGVCLQYICVCAVLCLWDLACLFVCRPVCPPVMCCLIMLNPSVLVHIQSGENIISQITRQWWAVRPRCCFSWNKNVLHVKG